MIILIFPSTEAVKNLKSEDTPKTDCLEVFNDNTPQISSFSTEQGFEINTNNKNEYAMGFIGDFMNEPSLAVIQESRCESYDVIKREKPATVTDESSCTDFMEYGDASILKIFMEFCGNITRYNSELKQWIVNDGKGWRVAHEREIRKVILSAISEYKRRIINSNDSQLKFDFYKSGNSINNKKINDILSLVRDKVAIENKYIDNLPDIILTRNGMINLQNGQNVGFNYSSNNLIIQKVNCVYNPEAQAPSFNNLLKRLTNDDVEQIEFIQRLIGYIFTGYRHEQIVPLILGDGGDGKTTFINIIRSVMHEYCKTIDPKLFLQKKKKSSTVYKELYALQNYRLLIWNGFEDGVTLDEELIKVVSGQDLLDCCSIDSTLNDFQIKGQFMFITNNLPNIKSTKCDIWRRIRVIRFNATFNYNEKKNMHLIQKQIESEAEGIFAWIVEGAIKYFRNGLGSYKSVDEETKKYRAEQNSVSIFAEDRIIRLENEGEDLFSATLYGYYRKYCEELDIPYCSHTAFGKAMKELGFHKKETSAGVIYLNIGVAE